MCHMFTESSLSAVYSSHDTKHTHTIFIAVNTGVLTTFRSDNTDGVGDGAFVFAYAVPCGMKRSVRPPQPQSSGALNRKLSEQCQKEFALCKTQRCDISDVSGLKYTT